MKLFVTGGSGFIGSVLVDDLLAHGYEVLALARSDKSADQLTKAGAQVIRGDLEDHEVLEKASKESDGVLHLGFIHDFENFKHSLDVDFEATKVIINALTGTGKPFIYTAGLLGLPTDIGVQAFETDSPQLTGSLFDKRLQTEVYALDFAKKGVRSMVIRLSPTVHGAGDHGFVPMLMKIATGNKAAYYIGEGKNTWPAVHRKDAAALYRLAIEKGTAGSAFHGAAEIIETKQIAEAMGKKLGVPAESVEASKAPEKLGLFGVIFAVNSSPSSEITKKELGWSPKENSLFEDISESY